MPYKLKKVDGGTKVVSPGHPAGFSKKPQSHEMARKQLVAIMIHTGENKAGKKVAPRKVGFKKGKK